MTDEGKRISDAGSGEVPQRDGTGNPEPSRNVRHDDQRITGTPAAGPANEELAWAKKHVPGHRTVRRPAKPVFRKTELLGIAPPAEPERIKKARQRTMKKIRDPGGPVAYRPFEDAFREFVCSLVEQQDRVYDEMLLHVADLGQQIDELERRVDEARRTRVTTMEAQG